MAVKKETLKKKQGGRGKAKPIIDTKKKTLNEKIEVVKALEKDLPKNQKESTKKNTRKTTKPKGGRPPVITQSVLDKLKLCFSVSLTDEEACYFCWISTDALYKYQRENPEFIKEKKILKDSITMQSKVNIWWSIKKWNVQDSKWWLEKKDKDFINKWVVEVESNWVPFLDLTQITNNYLK